MGFGGKKRKSTVPTSEFKTPPPPSKTIKRRNTIGGSVSSLTSISEKRSENGILRNQNRPKLNVDHFKNTDKDAGLAFRYFEGDLKAAYSTKISTKIPTHKKSDEEFKKWLFIKLLPDITENISVIREDELFHKQFVENVLVYSPWYTMKTVINPDPNSFGKQLHGKQNLVSEKIAKFMVEIVSYKPAFKSTVLDHLAKRIVSFNEAGIETWYSNLLKKLIDRDPMILSATANSLKSNFPTIASSIQTPESYATYLRVGLNFCLNFLKDEKDQIDLFNSFLTQLIKIDALLPTKVEENIQYQALVKLIDSGLCEFLNVIVRYNPTSIIKSAVFDQILMKSMEKSFCGYLFFVSATYELKDMLNFVFNKRLSEDVTVAKRSIIVLTGILGHSKRVNRSCLKHYLKGLVQWCLKYARGVEKTVGANSASVSRNMKPAVEKHGHFYAAITCILQVSVMRQSEIFHNQDTTFFYELQMNRLLLNRIMNPLVFCPTKILESYNNLMKYLFLPQITTKIEENKEFRALHMLTKNEGGQSNWNPLQWYDAFETESIKHLVEVKSRFLDEISFKFESIEHEEEESFVKDEEEEGKEKDSGVKMSDTTFENSTEESSNEESDFEEMDMPILRKMLSRERTISERSM